MGTVSQKPLAVTQLTECFITVLPHPTPPTFAIPLYHLPSQLLRFPIRIDACIRLHSQTRSERMAPRKGAAKPRKEAVGASRDKEWVPSKMGEAELNRMVAAGVLPDRVPAGWRPAHGEPFLTPHTDEAIVFEDYFWRGLGFPVHPFLRELLEFWAISLCNLHPNTILHVSVFIHFCEVFLGILPHFNLFRHLFCLKKKGGSGSKVVGGVYLQLRDGMANEYINVPLNTSLKGWNARWFYIKQSHLVIWCDVHHILESQSS